MPKLRLSKQQDRAYRRPCFLAEETGRDEFYIVADFRGRRIVIGLTANIGLE